MTIFERYLSIWVALCIFAGIMLGRFASPLFEALAGFEYANINFAVAVLIWAMVYPMMINVDLRSLGKVSARPKGLIITLVVNWMVKPFTMTLLGILFFKFIFADLMAPADAESYLAGLILLGAAPCTAMVFIWSQLTKGDPTYTLAQVSMNDVIMIFAFAPIVAFLLGVTDIDIPWQTLGLSVGLYVAAPLAAGAATRRLLRHKDGAIEALTAKLKPYSVVALLATVVLLFGFQGQTIVEKPLLIVLIAIPIIIQSYAIFAAAYAAAWLWKVPHAIAAPCALIGTSNFFELAVAVAISLFGLQSGAALATVVGVLVEVPVMLSLVAIANATRNRFAANHN
jgi:arsenite transporter